MSISDALDRAYTRPPLSWTYRLFRRIVDAAMTSPTRRAVTAAVVAASYGLAGAATGFTAAYGLAVASAVLLLGVTPFFRWRALRRAQQAAELAKIAGAAGLHDAAARLTITADRWRTYAQEIR
ncbi:hypothetical protein ACIODS_11785 [Micromonospora chalcea]|uniref:hypothetical protein n=1 Tax=Micromonospora chalcea TaxID=1874 RepID=UPI003809BF81